MKFSLEEKEKLALALSYAILWEESLMEAHSDCHDPDDDELRNKCNANIKAFEALQKRLVYAYGCSLRIEERSTVKWNELSKQLKDEGII